MSELTGSELLARQLRSEGVEDLFYLPGGPITAAAGFAADFGIRTIDCRHEQAAAMAAHAYARVKNRPGVCMAGLGAGHDQPAHGDRQRLPGRRAAGGAGRGGPADAL